MTESSEFGNFPKSQSASSAGHNANPPQKGSQFAVGQTLVGKYEVMSLIGVGGMGKVFKVRQVFLNKSLALKVLDMQQTMSELQLRRFQLEAKAAFSLSHPNLVKVFDFGLLETEDPYLVMDFVDGITLHDHLKKKGPLTPEQCVKVFMQAASGLAYAHQRSVVHRDIKPSNIMLDAQSKIGANNSIKIVDFGIAKVAESGETQGLTRTGEIFGSPLYMSPEQCSGELVDHRSDIYSLGCTLFEALTGTPPHVGNSALRTMMLHQTARTPWLHEASLGTTYPENLEQIVHRMLEKSPHDRYQDLDDVVEDLSKALSQSSIASKSSQSVTPISTLTAEPSGTVSMSPLNFGLVIVTVMALTSASTIGVERVIQHYNPEKKVEVVQHVAPKPIETPIPLAAEPDSTSETKPAEKAAPEKPSEAIVEAFEKAAIVKPSYITEGGHEYEVLNFPNKQVGVISNMSFAIPNPSLVQQFNSPAIGSVQFVPTKRLLLELEPFYPSFNYPKILKKMEPTLFQELVIQPRDVQQNINSIQSISQGLSPEYREVLMNNAAIGLSGMGSQTQQSNQLVKILENVVGWTELDGIWIGQMKVKAEAINALSKLKKLRYLRLTKSDADVAALAKEPFLKKLKYLSIDQIPCEEIIDAVGNSPNLESISISGAAVSADSIKKLQKAPHLTYFDISTATLDRDQMEAIADLEKVEVLSIRDSKLNPSQLKYFLANCPSMKKFQLNGPALEHFKLKLVEDPRIEPLQ